MTLVFTALNWVVSTTVGRIAAAALVGLVVWQWNNAVQRSKGAATVVAESREKAKAANAKNEKVRAEARRPGAAERLLRDSCRDCD